MNAKSEKSELCPERERCLTARCREAGYLCGFEIASTVEACPKGRDRPSPQPSLPPLLRRGWERGSGGE